MGEEQWPVVDLTNPFCPLLVVPLLRRPRPWELKGLFGGPRPREERWPPPEMSLGAPGMYLCSLPLMSLGCLACDRPFLFRWDIKC